MLLRLSEWYGGNLKHLPAEFALLFIRSRQGKSCTKVLPVEGADFVVSLVLVGIGSAAPVAPPVPGSEFVWPTRVEMRENADFTLSCHP